MTLPSLLLVIACTPGAPTSSSATTPTPPPTPTPTDTGEPCLGGEELDLCFEELPGIVMTTSPDLSLLGRPLDTRDVDGDGVPELLVGVHAYVHAYIVRVPIEGDIADQAVATLDLGPPPGSTWFAGDLTGDGVDDLVHNADGLAQVVAGPLLGDLGPGDVVATLQAERSFSVAAADFDGDGVSDLATDEGIRSGPVAGDLATHPLDVSYQLYDSGVQPRSFDPDGTGIANLWAAPGYSEYASLSAAVFLVDDPPSETTFRDDAVLASFSSRVFTFADVTGDGVADAITGSTAYPYYLDPGPPRVDIARGWASDAETHLTIFVPTPVWDADVGDFDADGEVDLAVGLDSGVVLLFFGPLPAGEATAHDADRVFVSRAPPVWDVVRDQYRADDGFAEHLHIADLDQDGHDDLVVAAPLAGPPDDNDGAVYVAWGADLR